MCFSGLHMGMPSMCKSYAVTDQSSLSSLYALVSKSMYFHTSWRLGRSSAFQCSSRTLSSNMSPQQAWQRESALFDSYILLSLFYNLKKLSNFIYLVYIPASVFLPSTPPIPSTHRPFSTAPSNYFSFVSVPKGADLP